MFRIKDVTKVEIITPDNLELVPTGEFFTLTLMKNRTLVLTCQTTLNCDYFDYGLSFRLNSTVMSLFCWNYSPNCKLYFFKQNLKNDVFLDEPIIDRMNCAKTRILLYKRTITISKITDNFNVQCDLIFGKDWIFPTKDYFVQVAGIIT